MTKVFLAKFLFFGILITVFGEQTKTKEKETKPKPKHNKEKGRL